jgi:hypothetical protein
MDRNRKMYGTEFQLSEKGIQAKTTNIRLELL